MHPSPAMSLLCSLALCGSPFFAMSCMKSILKHCKIKRIPWCNMAFYSALKHLKRSNLGTAMHDNGGYQTPDALNWGGPLVDGRGAKSRRKKRVITPHMKVRLTSERSGSLHHSAGIRHARIWEGKRSFKAAKGDVSSGASRIIFVSNKA